jgi:hypothetical protein
MDYCVTLHNLSPVVALQVISEFSVFISEKVEDSNEEEEKQLVITPAKC